MTFDDLPPKSRDFLITYWQNGCDLLGDDPYHANKIALVDVMLSHSVPIIDILTVLTLVARDDLPPEIIEELFPYTFGRET